MKPQSAFPARLRTLREAAGISQNELERRAGLANGAVSRLERGKWLPSIDTLRKLGAALGEDSLACWD